MTAQKTGRRVNGGFTVRHPSKPPDKSTVSVTVAVVDAKMPLRTIRSSLVRHVLVNDVLARTLFDTGTKTSLITYSFCDRAGIKVSCLPEDYPTRFFLVLRAFVS